MKKLVLLLSLSLSLSIVSCGQSNPPQGGGDDPSGESVDPTSITLDRTSLSLYESETYTFTATVLPEDTTNKDVTWVSSDSDIASITQEGVLTANKEGNITITVTSDALESVFATCEVSVLKKEETDDDDDIIFNAKKMEVVHYEKDKYLEADVYFRTDILTKLPYISLKDYYLLLLGKELEIEKKSKYVFEVTSANGEKAIFDTKQDTVDCDDYQNFISTTIYRQEGVNNVYYDGFPFLRVKEVVEHGDVKHITIDFKKYNVNLVTRDDNILIPLATASNMFMGPTMITCFYNTKAIYFIDPNNLSYDTDTVIANEDFCSGIMSFYDDEKRTKEEAEFSYGEICFLIDTYYGCPGRETLHDSLKEYDSLDLALENHDEMTKKAKELMLSTDVSEYFAGSRMVAAYLYDAGHTVFDSGIQEILWRNAYKQLKTKVNQILNSLKFDIYEVQAPANWDSYYYYYLRQQSRPCEDESYKVVGDTIIYRFDSFMFDPVDWVKYYENPMNNELPKDMLGNFKRLLDKYEGNKSITNIVLDITTNGGGFADGVVALMGLMGKPTYAHQEDQISKNSKTIYYEFDANFDGKFDEEDAKVQYQFRYSILTTARSFSCGNMLPAQAKENGIMILGDKSGGGCCAVIDAASPEGLYLRLSCQDHMTALDGSSIEFGVPVHYQMVEYLENNYYDFSKLYDVSLMSQQMNNFYSK